MIKSKFEWDEKKASLNIKNHGVSFETAQTVFNDPLARIFDDELHSFGERREIIIGHDYNYQLLLVCFTEKSGIIRIISARLATKRERQNYEEHTSI